MDRAGPLFSTISLDQRLSKDDAMKVEVIHTDNNGSGFSYNDFYSNGRRFQPGGEDYPCSHTRVYQYFAESLDPKSKGFYGQFCDDGFDTDPEHCHGEAVLMGGLFMKYGKIGKYYVKTNNESPYARVQ